MIGLLLWYWVGKYFYKLAEEHKKNKWVFAVLGIVVYYAGSFAFGILIGFFVEIFSPGFIDTVGERFFGFLMIPFGVLSCYLFYKVIEEAWKKNIEVIDLEDFGKEDKSPITRY